MSMERSRQAMRAQGAPERGELLLLSTGPIGDGYEVLGIATASSASAGAVVSSLKAVQDCRQALSDAARTLGADAVSDVHFMLHHATIVGCFGGKPGVVVIGYGTALRRLE